MTSQSNGCACVACSGAQCKCGCQNPLTQQPASCQCGDACNCGETCTCKSGADATSRPSTGR